MAKWVTFIYWLVLAHLPLGHGQDYTPDPLSGKDKNESSLSSPLEDCILEISQLPKSMSNSSEMNMPENTAFILVFLFFQSFFQFIWLYWGNCLIVLGQCLECKLNLPFNKKDVSLPPDHVQSSDGRQWPRDVHDGLRGTRTTLKPCITNPENWKINNYSFKTNLNWHSSKS